MADDRFRNRQTRRPAKPLDPARLEEMALAYVARFSTSAAKFERYLTRKLREKGWEGEGEPPVDDCDCQAVPARDPKSMRSGLYALGMLVSILVFGTQGERAWKRKRLYRGGASRSASESSSGEKS